MSVNICSVVQYKPETAAKNGGKKYTYKPRLIIIKSLINLLAQKYYRKSHLLRLLGLPCQQNFDLSYPQQFLYAPIVMVHCEAEHHFKNNRQN